jgi:hypothetical protein
MKLESLVPSTSATKKYKAVFRLDNGKTKTIHFGAKGYSDYIQSGSEEKKAAYIARHKVNENFNNPMTAGSLSRYILWNKSTLSASIADFKKRFNL